MRPGEIAGLRFVQATFADADAIERLTRAAYAKWVPVIGREPLPMTFRYAGILLRERVDLANLNGKLAGLVHSIRKDNHLLIENLATDPWCQSAGIGSALLAHVEATAREQDLPEVRLYTNAAFAGNIRFYGSRGYIETAREPFMGGTTVHMSKSLA